MSVGEQNTPLQGEGIYGVLPPVRQITEVAGTPFYPTVGTRVVIAVAAQEQALRAEAELLAAELAELPPCATQADKPQVQEVCGASAPMPRQVAVGAQPQPGDVVLQLVDAVVGTSSPEAYYLEATAQQFTITAATTTGIFYGTRTLLQCLALSGGVQACTVLDEPAKPVRGLHVDAGRKYFSAQWLQERLREMAWLKLNELQLHFSENEGFRLESRSHPEVVSEQHLTQAELGEVLATAARYHVQVVPALDVPGHMRQVLNAHPELRASDSEAGQLLLDYSRPDARSLVTELLDELVPLFGAQAWHLGGDEVFPMGGPAWEPGLHETLAQDYPRLAAYAREQVGPQATVLDGYVHYLGTVVAHLRHLGVVQVRAWNDALGVPGTSRRLDADVVITYWTAWHQGFAPVQDFVDAGHQVINFNDARFYYVLTTPGRAYWNKPTVEAAYAWQPGCFPELPGGRPQTWGPEESWDQGAVLSVWCDVPEAETEAEVAAGIRPLLAALASRVWNPGDQSPYELWYSRLQHLAAASV
ncbi:Beta-hexosaminidase [Actinomyces bovis]|uniref:Beta-hexosaminidase n=1 Tax=Actinomyces bovis TaxID=1658 RepID=A0ABY1VNM5_9ACTO|nr:family 20 glycosylhydrolase [Actinomyces bovis]SPT53716.1 Beta-hexosaminidase [Actinomyces bovis]VEG55863.1 Beta-hexosaminidase [Actinomyces israelii]